MHKFEKVFEQFDNEGINLSVNGISADFAGTPYLYPAKGKEKAIVLSKLTGSRVNDSRLAYELSGIAPSKHYIWHHLDDYNPELDTCTMQLVHQSVHEACIPAGSAIMVAEEYHNFKYE